MAGGTKDPGWPIVVGEGHPKFCPPPALIQIGFRLETRVSYICDQFIMDNTVSYHQCPVCASAQIEKVLTCKDHTVSQQLFEVWECRQCSFRFTQHAPLPENIGAYYQSEAYISHSDTGKGLINKLYKIARRYTLGRKRHFIQKITGMLTGNILDVGCGTGAFIQEMKKAGWQTTGLEPDAGSREKAYELYGLKPLPIDKLFSLPASSYHAITLWHVLEHVHDLNGYLQQLKQLLKPGAKLVLAVPNYTSSDAAFYQQHWAAYDTPRHLWHFSPASMRKLAADNGFNVISTHPMWLDAFYVSMLSEQHKNGSLHLFAAIKQGFINMRRTLGNREQCSSVVYVLQSA